MRGEHVLDGIAEDDTLGSSPHTRGAPRGRDSRRVWPGIIPAYAGCCRGRAASRGDYPRIRGEHVSALPPATAFRGSSPHTRGALRDAAPVLALHGIIPAYAGSTRLVLMMMPTCWDHPRIRGEHEFTPLTSSNGKGSSPHTRGARLAVCQNRLQPGTIPAYAGSTNRLESEWSALWDHPRIRGEHLTFAESTYRARGSSPHTRGARKVHRAHQEGRGIIPAYAGSTKSVNSPCGARRDHPRIRGEHSD